MEFTELEVPVEKYPGVPAPSRVVSHPISSSSSSNNNLNVRHLGRGDSRENWDPIRSAREREFREKPPPMLKIAVVGDSAVGKTTICEAFTAENGFNFSKKYHMTCGVQVYAKSIPVSGSETNGEVPLLHYGPRTERVNLILLDSASKDIYLELLPKYWDKLDGFALVIDVTNPASLTAAARWLDLVKGNVDMKMGMLGILVANKVEMAEERQISTSMAQEFCDANNLHYFEASARENSGVEDAFKYLANEWNSRKLPLK